MSSVEGVLTAAADVQRRLDEMGLEFCFIGGLAVARWGEARYTQDVDLTVLCPFGDEEHRARELVSALSPRIEDAVEFAMRRRVLLLQSPEGTPIDISLGALAFEVNCVSRSSYYDYSLACRIRTCSAADLVVMKAFAGRERDWDDIRGILTRRGAELDWTLIQTELEPLLELKGEPEAWDRLLGLKRKHP